MASPYPSRPIKLVIPFSAGGGTDTYARIIKKAIEDERLLPQPLVIINIDGAGATIGSRRVKDSPPDGYTVLLLHDAILTAQASGNVAYGPEAFEAVAATGEVGMVIAVADDSDYETLDDLMRKARERPDVISFGANMGALTHYAGLQLEQELAGARFRFVQCGGGAERFADLKGGHVDVTGFSIEEFLRFRADGLRGLAYFGDKRHPAAPDVPTAREQRFDVISTNTFYWWVPRGTAPDRIEILATALDKALQTEYVQAKLREIHCEPFFLRGEELRDRIRRSAEGYARVTTRPSTRLPNFPVLVVSAVFGLALLAAARHWQRFGTVGQPRQWRPRAPGRKSDGNTRLAIVCVAWLLLYVAVMTAGWLGFRLATVAFVLVLGLLLQRAHRRRLFPVLLATALLAGFGIHLLFTQYLAVDLP